MRACPLCSRLQQRCPLGLPGEHRHQDGRVNSAVVGLSGAAVRALSLFPTGGFARGFIYPDVHGPVEASQTPDLCSFAELSVGNALHTVA